MAAVTGTALLSHDGVRITCGLKATDSVAYKRQVVVSGLTRIELATSAVQQHGHNLWPQRVLLR